ncbi:MAG: DUF4825 domain-containing protein, partial [Oscillospiraceae bacterium]|nr:DUF4825 domain-containing protein [Oscillospiraceae bacterium]
DGVSIRPAISRIFAAAHAYIGDMPANGKLASALGISDRLGAFTHELQTDQEPYGWVICLEETYSVLETHKLQSYMDGYSCAMLALVDNLGYVQWEYEDEWGTKTYTVTSEQAAELLGGEEIKSWGQSASRFQELADWLGLDVTFTVTAGLSTSQSDEAVIAIASESEMPLLAISIHYALGDQFLTSIGACNADGKSDLFGSDEALSFGVRQEDLGGLTSMELAEVTFDLYVTDMDGQEYLVAEKVCPGLLYGWTYSYTITDDGNGGLTLQKTEQDAKAAISIS